MSPPSDLLVHVGKDNEHLLRYWDELTDSEKEEFSHQVHFPGIFILFNAFVVK